MDIKKYNEFGKEEPIKENYWENINGVEGANYDMSVVDYLSAAYQLWCSANNLPQLSAEEQDVESLTESQREFNRHFIHLWHSATHFESEL